MGRFRAKPRSNGYDIDVKAPDGFTLGGWRRVTKKGYVRFAGETWTHPAMANRQGEYAFLHVDCPLGSEVSFTFDPAKKWHSPWNGRQMDGGRTPLEPYRAQPLSES